MADVITRLKVDSKEYDSKIERARSGLLNLERSLQKAGKSFADADEEQVAFVKELGKMDTQAQTAKGKIGEMSKAFIDLSLQYKKMTDLEKESPFGKAMAQSLDQLKMRVQDAKNEIKELEGELNGSQLGGGGGGGLFGGDKFGGMIQVLGGNLMTKAVGMFANLASEMGDMVVQGIELAKQGEGIRIAFERLGRGDIMDGLREATHGTVTDVELMKAAVKFNDFKLPIEELGTMLAFAQQKAKDTGQSVDYMVDSIVTGLGRKSLMILDNLGLSAAEIKDKMAQTGDMTKAVGAIIREQMAKAGDYIETAADKATEANVRLKNAMTELGDALTPLTNDFNTFWNDIKVAGLNFIKDVITPMLNQLTEAGRIANRMKDISGNEQVNNQIDILRRASSRAEQVSTYRQIYHAYGDQIRDYNTMIANGGKMPGAGSGESRSIKWLEAQVGALRQMREEFDKRAMEILWPNVDTGTTVTATGGKGGKGGNTTKPKEEYIPLAGSIDWMQQQVKELQTEFEKTADDAVRGKLYEELQKVKLVIDSMNSGMSMTLDRTQGGSLTDSLGLGFNADKLGKVELKASETSERRDEMSFMQKYDKAVAGFSSIAGGLRQLGIKLPEGLDTLLGGLQGLSTIISGVTSVIELFSSGVQTANTVALTANTVALGALTSAVAANTAFSFIPFFSNGGIAHAAGGLQVPGNWMSGDMVPAMLNSGETVLNRAQAGVIAAALQQESYTGRSQQSVVIQGEDLIIALNNAYRRRGMGEIVTTKMR